MEPTFPSMAMRRPGPTDCVAHGQLAQGRGLVHQGPHLVRTEGDVHGTVPGAGAGAAGGGELYDVRPYADHLADHGPDRSGSVGNGDRAHRVAGKGGAVARGGETVADSAAGGDDGHGANETRALYEAFGDGLF